MRFQKDKGGLAIYFIFGQCSSFKSVLDTCFALCLNFSLVYVWQWLIR
jgi:hypothetical protein